MRTDLKAESPGTDQRINRSADNPKRRMAVKTSHGTRRVGSDGALPQWPAAGRLVLQSQILVCSVTGAIGNGHREIILVGTLSTGTMPAPSRSDTLNILPGPTGR